MRSVKGNQNSMNSLERLQENVQPINSLDSSSDATADRDPLRRYPATPLLGQEKDSVCNVFGGANTRCSPRLGDQPCDHGRGRLILVLEQRPGQIGQNRTGGHRVHGDAVALSQLRKHVSFLR